MPQDPTKPQPSSPTSSVDEEPRGFLQRWSKRKVEATTNHPAAPKDGTIELSEATSPELSAGDVSEQEAADEEAPAAVTEADLENLTYESDYTKFMGEQVPEAIRRQALRQLWRSDPVLANLDGLCDYDDDFTDAALAVKVLETTHKVGQGYLSDEDVAANRARGTPPEEAAAADEIAEADDEEIEVCDDDVDTGEEAAVANKAAEDAAAETVPQRDLDMKDTSSKT